MRIEWTVSSLADLDRFLHERDPALATRIAAEIRERERLVMLRVFHGRELRE